MSEQAAETFNLEMPQSDAEAFDAVARAMGVGAEEPRARSSDGRFAPKEQPSEEQASEPAQDGEQAQEEGEVSETADEAAQTVAELLAEADLAKKGKVKINGEELEVTVKEALEGYQRQQDYNRNLDELRNKEKTIAEEAQKRVNEERTKAIQALEALHASVLHTTAPELQNVDWPKLASEDPAKYVQLMARQQQVNGTLQRIAAAHQQLQAQKASEEAQARAKAIQESKEAIVKAIPDWSDERYQQLMKRAVDTYGWKLEDIASEHDPKVIRLLNDAHAYHALQDQMKSASKKVQEAPKVLKPGVKPAQNGQQARAKEAANALKRDGSVESFARLYQTAFERR